MSTIDMSEPSFQKQLIQHALLVDQTLESLLVDNSAVGERQRPSRLVEAMRHGVLNGGKRIRPFLMMQSAALFGVPAQTVLEPACALECLHCYSLIHDDLPSMDNDDLRRGQPTVHKAYDEATAILAGDALLTLAFDLTANNDVEKIASLVSLELVSLLARASGWGGMIGGQMLDIEAENTTPNEAGIRNLQAMKTGALIRYACEAGAVIGKASSSQRNALIQYGETIGLAFQLADDLLDVTADAAAMGKNTGKDADRGKATLVAIHGVENTRKMLADAVEQAQDILVPFGNKAEALQQCARFIAERES